MCFGKKRLWQVSSSATRLYSGCDSIIKALEQPLLKAFAGCAGRGSSCFDYPYVYESAPTNEQSGLPLRGMRLVQAIAEIEII